MVWETILYTSFLVAFIAFFILYERGFSLKNSFLINLTNNTHEGTLFYN